MALLLWSGGCDSTFLLYDLLTAHQFKKPTCFVALKDGEFVRTLSINHPQVAGGIYNRRARDVLRPLLQKKFKNNFVCGEIEISQNGLFIDSYGGIVQPPLWLLHASLYLDRDEDLYAGYIRGDDLWHHRDQLYEAFSVIQSFTGRTGRLLLPLEWVTKAEIIVRLKRARLLKHTWYCELSKDGRCCRQCPSCYAHDTALWRLTKGFENYTEGVEK
jgi:hypothetical protein